MANIMVLVPRRDMVEQTLKVAREEQIDLMDVRRIDTPDAVTEARQAALTGANIIVARGLQAQMIKHQTNIPVIEIKLTGQELGLLVLRAKHMLPDKPHPAIAFVGFRNHFSSMTYFDELFSVNVRTYYVTQTDELTKRTEQAAVEGADVIIGGDTVVLTARQLGIPVLFNESTDESIREALYIAERAAYAINAEKQHSAQTQSILGASVSGILKIDDHHQITMNNRVMEDLLDKLPGTLVGRRIEEVLPELDPSLSGDILSGQKDQITTLLRIKDKHQMVVAAPIEVDGTVSGAIFTFQNLPSVKHHDSEEARNIVLSGHVARGGFEQILRTGKAMRHEIELAKSFALSRNPVMLYGEIGTETESFAQGIHSAGARRHQPYVSIGLYDCEPELQAEILLGEGTQTNKGALLSANFGTLVIHDIDRMTPRCQYALSRAITTRALMQSDIHRVSSLDVRLIASATQDLTAAVAQGRFRQDLYHLLTPLQMEIPPLREDINDIPALVEHFTHQYTRQYAKYTEVSEGALKALMAFDWPGNLIQLERFIERLVIGCTKRTIDQGTVMGLYHKLYPEVKITGATEKLVVSMHPEALKLSAVLDKNGGSRLNAAKELGISTTTLWRRMKKYGIDEKYQ